MTISFRPMPQLTPAIPVDRFAQGYGLGRTHGVAVTTVVPGSVADEAGLQRWDIIREIYRKPIRNLSDYTTATEGTGREKRILFLIQREDKTIFLVLRRDK
jgi:S1-C subfamily serine protease